MIPGFSMPRYLWVHSQESCGALLRRGFPLDGSFERGNHKVRIGTHTVAGQADQIYLRSTPG